MAWNRPLLAAAILASILLSAALTFVGWVLFDIPFFALFLFLPFLPILFYRPRAEPLRACPGCGWSTREPDLHYCPRDGQRLGGEV